MPVFPAAKSGDTINGIDIHKVSNPVHPFVGQINTMNSPAFPRANVFINGVPACSVGATSISMHVPQGVPVDPSNILYFTKQFTNTKLSGVLNSFTTFANKTITEMAKNLPKPNEDDSFIKETTGIDPNETIQEYQKIITTFTAASKWSKWPSFLMAPLPYPAAQACVVSGSPTVTINGAPMAYTGGLTAFSCSDVPVLPNANIVGFTNVYVGLTYQQTAQIEWKEENEYSYVEKGGVHLQLVDTKDQFVTGLEITVTSNTTQVFKGTVETGEIILRKIPKGKVKVTIHTDRKQLHKNTQQTVKWQKGLAFYSIEKIYIHNEETQQ